MTYQHMCATIPCQVGEQQFMAWLDEQKNEHGYNLLSVVAAQMAAPNVDHAALRNGGPVLLGQQQAVPCWFVILRRALPEQPDDGKFHINDFLQGP